MTLWRMCLNWAKLTAKQDTPAIWSGMKMTRNEGVWVKRPNDLIVWVDSGREKGYWQRRLIGGVGIWDWGQPEKKKSGQPCKLVQSMMVNSIWTVWKWGIWGGSRRRCLAHSGHCGSVFKCENLTRDANFFCCCFVFEWKSVIDFPVSLSINSNAFTL